MQTFLISPDFSETAKCLDYRRLGKQRVEAYQILKTLAKGPFYYDVLYYFGCKKLKTPWYNHPAVKMWKNFDLMLCQYGWHMCEEWKKRGFKDNLQYKILHFCGLRNILDAKKPLWMENEKIYSSHRSALLAKNFEYYRQFGWKEEPKIKYYWPV